MHMPRLSCVAWIIYSSAKGTPHCTGGCGRDLLYLQPSEIEPEDDGLEAGRGEGLLDGVAPTRGRPHRNHASPARPADLGRSPFGARNLGDAVDLRRGDAGSQALARPPFG